MAKNPNTIESAQSSEFKSAFTAERPAPPTGSEFIVPISKQARAEQAENYRAEALKHAHENRAETPSEAEVIPEYQQENIDNDIYPTSVYNKAQMDKRGLKPAHFDLEKSTQDFVDNFKASKNPVLNKSAAQTALQALKALPIIYPFAKPA